MKPTYQLLGLKLKETSFVDRGANQEAHILLFKNDAGSELETVKMDGVRFAVAESKIANVTFECSAEWDEDLAKAWLTTHRLTATKFAKTDDDLCFFVSDVSKEAKLRTMIPGEQMTKALRQGQSYSHLQEMISDAVRDKYQPENPQPGECLWVRDVFADDVVFDQDGTTWRAGYMVEQINGETRITIGDRVEVEVTYQDIMSKSTILALKFAKLEAELARARITF